jgi:poly-gamma-glutamate capsule biosynthesis protein CapA/YwtB (metallophosphatase superfamily)
MQIAFLGDISFNDAYTRLYASGVNPFLWIGEKLADCDLVIGNLECLAEGRDGVNEKKKPRLKTSIETLNFLESLNVSALTLAHNHVYDNLKDGFERTIAFLDGRKIEYLGAGLEPEKAAKPWIVDREGIKICFLSCVHPDTHPSLPEDSPIYLNYYNRETLSGEIRKYRESGHFVVLLLHWGGRFEGGIYPDRYQSSDARAFIDAGADLVVGHHSHTLQAMKSYRGRQIFYSLGNFCFADILSDGRIRSMSRKAFRESVIPVLQLNRDHSYSVQLIPIRNRDLAIEEHRPVLRKLARRNRVQGLFETIPACWHLYRLYFRTWAPVWEQLTRKDPEKTLFRRMLGLNRTKIRQLMKSR